ncbi:head-tail adaptor protein [Jannaschia ovalis]|uniref:Head-tail adaptor protein n=1 Tax=Jannaschia ovalis TaxID=3038773 RepID=A0ABY8LAJ8_9RHOB|nr:head-tail adaptor protein [Jannaschia sp. GRR-S6-38]WGH78357.1 head-tail adaptor protein [Jannaschia sp. GRR-S6-38]
MSHQFNRRLEHFAPVSLPDGTGGRVTSWEARGAFWAAIRMRSGALRPTEFGRDPRLRVRLRTHAIPQGHATRPEAGHRLRDGARVYEVEAVHDGDDMYLTILAAETPGAEDLP